MLSVSSLLLHDALSPNGQQFLCICQQALSKSLNKLLQYTKEVHSDFDMNESTNLFFNQIVKNRFIWQKYLVLNQSLVNLCADIERTSEYWSTYLTILMIGQITIQSYMAYITFFVSDIPLNSLVIFAYAAVFMEVIIFMLVYFSSKVAKCSSAIERANAQFFMNFSQLGGFKFYLPKGQVLKVMQLFSIFVNLCFIYFYFLGRMVAIRPPSPSVLYGAAGQLPHHLKDLLPGHLQYGALLPDGFQK